MAGCGRELPAIVACDRIELRRRARRAIEQTMRSTATDLTERGLLPAPPWSRPPRVFRDRLSAGFAGVLAGILVGWAIAFIS